jgi:hypothetical protein
MLHWLTYGAYSKEFPVLLILSILISTLIAYHFMNHWIADYSYRTDINWWIFAVASVGTAIFTLATVSFQTIKVAKEDPAKILKSE